MQQVRVPDKHKMSHNQLGAIDEALADAEHVVKKQKTCTKSAADCLKVLIMTVEEAKAVVKTGQDPRFSMHFLLQQIEEEIGMSKLKANLTRHTKELHAAVSKLGKVCVYMGCMMLCFCYAHLPSGMLSSTEH